MKRTYHLLTFLVIFLLDVSYVESKSLVEPFIPPHFPSPLPKENPSISKEGCYWMENVFGKYQWVLTSEALGKSFTSEECFQMDSCDGGLGASSGGCYMWSTSKDGPRISWKDLGFIKEDLTPMTYEQLSSDGKSKVIGKNEKEFGYAINSLTLNGIIRDVKKVKPIRVKSKTNMVLEFNSQLWNTVGCPRCIAQLVVSLDGDINNSYCAYSDIPKVYTGSAQRSSVTIVAPKKAGTYKIYLDLQLQYSCEDAKSITSKKIESGDNKNLILMDIIEVVE